MTGLRQVVDDQQLAVLVDPGRPPPTTRVLTRAQKLVKVGGGAEKDLSAAQARTLLARVRPRDAAAKPAAGPPLS